MPTKILYELTGVFHKKYYKIRDSTPTFFETYNPFAVEGSRNHRNYVRPQDSENDFLSKPADWAEDVVKEIEQLNPHRKKRLREVGRFLFDANLHDLFLENLTQTHIGNISERYSNAYHLLKSNSSTKELSQTTLDLILDKYNIKARITVFKTGYGTKKKYVHKRQIRKFLNSVNTYLLSDESLRRVEGKKLKIGWDLLRDELPVYTSNGISQELLIIEKEPTNPTMNLFEYGERIEKHRLSEIQRKQLEIDREMLIQSDLGRKIAELIKNYPLKNERNEVLDNIGISIKNYSSILIQNNGKPELRDEAREIIRRGQNLFQSRPNNYTQKVNRKIKQLEQILK